MADELIEVITIAGRAKILSNSFELTNEKFVYMGMGTSTDDPTELSTGLGRECDPDTHGNYFRLDLRTGENLVDVNETTGVVKLSGIFLTNNVTNQADITEVAIFDSATLGQGTPLCICQIAPFRKTSAVSLKVDITITLEKEEQED